MANQIPPADIDEQEIDLRALILVLRKRLVLIVMLSLLAALASGLVSYYVLQPVYEAKTVLLVTQAVDKLQTTSPKEDLGDIDSISRMPVPTMNTYIGQVKNDEMMRRVIESMNLAESGYTPRGLAGLVNVTSPKDSYLLEVTVRNNNPQLAMDIANTLNEEFIGSFNERNREMMDRSLQFQEEQLAQIRSELAKATVASERARLQGMLTQMSEGFSKTQITRSFYLGGTSLVVVSPAIVAAQVAPNKQMNIAIAFLLGLMVSVALAFLLEFLDNTLKTPEDVAQHLGLPVLGVIPAEGSHGGYYGNYYQKKG